MGSMFQSKVTQTTEIPSAGGQESQLRDLLAQLAHQAGGAIDMDALTQLASGQLLSPTGADEGLIAQSVQASQEIAERAARSQYEDISAQVENDLLERGIEGSSIEAVNQAILGRQMQQQLADVSSQGQQFGSQALMNLPFQRAGVQLSANQQLLQQLLGGAGTGIQAGLSERLAQGTTTQTTDPGLGNMLQQQLTGAGQIAGMFATGGATAGMTAGAAAGSARLARGGR